MLDFHLPIKTKQKTRITKNSKNMEYGKEWEEKEEKQRQSHI
jgi:hypothetical protein